MALLGIDLGGSKLALGIFSESGEVLFKESLSLGKRKGPDVGVFMTDRITEFLMRAESEFAVIRSIGISVPGISYQATGKVWAPNIPGWTDYPLLEEVRSVAGQIPVTIDSDRACYILGEAWQGNARGCRDAIFLSVGTGIGAGILINGEILRGSRDIAGCIGWMALQRPYNDKYKECGCFEYYASGEGIPNVARELLQEADGYSGEIAGKPPESITSPDLFLAREKGDALAIRAVNIAVEYWGMAVANLVSLFNPEKIIFGGGVFGPAVSLIPAIRDEAAKWAQPVSINQVILDVSGLEGDAGMYGAGFLALRQLHDYKV
jgi:glucokinase